MNSVVFLFLMRSLRILPGPSCSQYQSQRQPRNFIFIFALVHWETKILYYLYIRLLQIDPCVHCICYDWSHWWLSLKVCSGCGPCSHTNTAPGVLVCNSQERKFGKHCAWIVCTTAYSRKLFCLLVEILGNSLLGPQCKQIFFKYLLNTAIMKVSPATTEH